MEIYRTEQEQIDQLKKLWQKYGNPLVWGLILALALSYGWRYWQNRQHDVNARASLIFQQLLSSVEQNKSADLAAQAERLQNHYQHTPYAMLAAMQLAKSHVQQGKLAEAEQQLQWVIANAKDPALKQLAVLRAARIMVAQEQAQQAINLLEQNPSEIFTSYWEEVRGDALLALHKSGEARKAYAHALELISAAENTRPLLQMKYDAIPETNT
jgi:predicted negative regulator of RcsB-dependent stress response